MSTRFRSGFVQLVRCRVAESTAIEPGDLLWLDGGYAKPASDFPWTADLATTRGAFAAKFLGIAHTGSAAGETDDVSVDVSPLAVYEAGVVSTTYDVGDAVAPAETLDALSSRTVERVTNVAQAIGRAAENAAESNATLRCCFASSFHAASANVNAAIG